MKHTATRLGTGLYLYRGYEITKHEGDGYVYWNITVQGDYDTLESCDTLAICKLRIDQNARNEMW